MRSIFLIPFFLIPLVLTGCGSTSSDTAPTTQVPAKADVSGFFFDVVPSTYIGVPVAIKYSVSNYGADALTYQVSVTDSVAGLIYRSPTRPFPGQSAVTGTINLTPDAAEIGVHKWVVQAVIPTTGQVIATSPTLTITVLPAAGG